MIEDLQAWAQTFPEWAQWFAVLLVAAIPFVESYSGTVIGVAIGLHPVAAASAAITGNAAAMLAVVLVTSRIRTRVRSAQNGPDGGTKRRQRLRRLFERFGIPGVALLGHPTQISSGAMVGFGADRTKVIAWELTSIVLWGAIFAVIAGLGIEALLH